jgi:hypothetical protein
MDKMTNCPVCGSLVAKSAKTCPACGAKQKRRSPLGTFIGVVILVIIAIIALFPEDEQSPVDDTLSDEENAEILLNNAESQFENDNYAKGIDLCNQIKGTYPDTNTAATVDDFLKSKIDTYPSFTAKELMSEYVDNVVNADKEYTDKVVVITGTINDIGKTNNDSNLAVSLKSGQYFQCIQLNFDTDQEDAVATLAKDQSIRVIGRCSGFSGKILIVFDGQNVMIEDCYLLS